MSILSIPKGMKAVTRLLTDAETEANREGAPEIAAEHIVLAALRDPAGSGSVALVAAGGTPERFRAALAEAHAAALAGIGITAPAPAVEAPDVVPGRGRYRMTPGARRLFQSVAEQRAARRDGAALGAQVMLALTREETGAAARALDIAGVDRETLAEAARAQIAR